MKMMLRLHQIFSKISTGISTFLGHEFLRNQTNSYDFSFYVAGSVIFISAVLCYPLNLIKKWQIKRRKENVAC
jgi:hypothetical protein